MMGPDDFPIPDGEMFLCFHITQLYGMGHVKDEVGDDAAPYVDGVVLLVLAELGGAVEVDDAVELLSSGQCRGQ